MKDYFADMARSIRCTTIESVYSAIDYLQVFSKASVLDDVVPDFGIIAARSSISIKIQAYVDKNVNHFKQLLRDCNLSGAYTLALIFEELVYQHPEISEFVKVNLQGLHLILLLLAKLTKLQARLKCM